MRPTTRTNKRSRCVLLAVVAALAVLAAACGEADTSASTDNVASISDNANVADTGESSVELEAPENPEDAFELFNQCMEDAGFGGAISVSVGGSEPGGSISISSDDGGLGLGEVDPQHDGFSVEDFDAEEFTAANEACRGHLASIDQGFDMSPEEQARFEDAQLEFSDCMEGLGIEVPDFGDSTGIGGGGIVIAVGEEVEIDPQTGQPSLDDIDFEAFNDAAEECRHVFEELAGRP